MKWVTLLGAVAAFIWILWALAGYTRAGIKQQIEVRDGPVDEGEYTVVLINIAAGSVGEQKGQLVLRGDVINIYLEEGVRMVGVVDKGNKVQFMYVGHIEIAMCQIVGDNKIVGHQLSWGGRIHNLTIEKR